MADELDDLLMFDDRRVRIMFQLEITGIIKITNRSEYKVRVHFQDNQNISKSLYCLPNRAKIYKDEKHDYVYIYNYLVYKGETVLVPFDAIEIYFDEGEKGMKQKYDDFKLNLSDKYHKVIDDYNYANLKYKSYEEMIAERRKLFDNKDFDVNKIQWSALVSNKMNNTSEDDSKTNEDQKKNKPLKKVEIKNDQKTNLNNNTTVQQRSVKSTLIRTLLDIDDLCKSNDYKLIYILKKDNKIIFQSDDDD